MNQNIERQTSIDGHRKNGNTSHSLRCRFRGEHGSDATEPCLHAYCRREQEQQEDAV